MRLLYKHNKHRYSYFALCIVSVLFSSFIILKKDKRTFYIIGDSTVKNGSGSGSDKLWGWGSFIADYFDTTKINIRNEAIGGRSSRTFITEGRWDKIMANLRKDDYVIMQFGHNDSGPLDDTARARGSIRGTGSESKEIYNPIMKKQEVVHTYGWYMRKYINDAKAKGAIPIVCSPVPRNDWKDGKVIRASENYGKWAQEVAKQEGAYFIDLNNLIAEKYEALGADKVKSFFPGDHTQTNLEGAKINAQVAVNALKEINSKKIKKFILK